MKAVAALRDQSLKEFLVEAVQREMHREHRKQPVPDTIPVIGSRKPGSLRLTNAEIEDILSRTLTSGRRWFLSRTSARPSARLTVRWSHGPS